MNKFDLLYNNAIYAESAIHINRYTLDPNVFEMDDESPPRLYPGIKAQIMQGVNEIGKTVEIEQAILIGSILTNNFSQRSDIDINIQINKSSLDNMTIEDVQHTLKGLNGKLAVGTLHPINYFISVDEYDFDNSDAVYDIMNDKWLKTPKDRDIDVGTYVKQFDSNLRQIISSIDRIRRDVINLEEIKSLPKKHIQKLRDELNNILDSIEQEGNSLITLHKNVKDMRKLAFSRFMTPEEIRQIGSRNNLPENIIYKFLERYYYSDFINKLNKILSNGIDSEIGTKILKAGKDMWKESADEYVEEKNKFTIRGPKRKFVPPGPQYKKPFWKYLSNVEPRSASRHGANLARGTHRKTLSQLAKRYSTGGFAGIGIDPSTERLIKIAKKAPSGFVRRLTKTEVREIATKYKFNVPDDRKPIKHLGSTGIEVIRQGPNRYYLIKPQGSI